MRRILAAIFLLFSSSVYAATPMINCSGSAFLQSTANPPTYLCNTPSGSGNVSGPGSSTNNYIPQWNGTGGTLLKAGIPVSTFLQAANNLSDLGSTATAVSNLGLVIGMNTEAWSSILDAVAEGTYTGATSITTLGTIATGTWAGTTIAPGYGGTGTSTAFTQGSVVFAGASGNYAQDNSNFFYSLSSHRLGLGGNTSPNGPLDVQGNFFFEDSNTSPTTVVKVAPVGGTVYYEAASGFSTGNGIPVCWTDYNVSHSWMCLEGDGGLVVGSPTGGDKGAGTINAAGIYLNGTAVSTTTGTVTSIATSTPITGGTITGTGTIACPTCATVASGGALSGVGAVVVSNTGAISITGVAGEVMAGSTAAFTASPTINTSVTTPVIYGGSSTGSALSLDGTSNGSPSAAYVLLNSAVQGNVGIGTASPTTGQLQIGGTNSSTSDFDVNGTNTSAVTGNIYGALMQEVFNPQGASLNSLVGSASYPAISGSSSLNIAIAYGYQSLIALNSGYTGILNSGVDYYAQTPSLNGGTALGTFAAFEAAAITNGNGITTGTTNNFGFQINSATAAAASGGTVNNHGLQLNLATGSGAGTTSNYGLEITGNGGSGGAGTTNNYAIYDSSTAAAYINGSLGLGSSSPASVLQISGNRSAASWTTQGLDLGIVAATLTDTTSSSGSTIATRAANSIGTPTNASTNTETITNAVNLYISAPPTASGNVTQTNSWAEWINSGNLNLQSGNYYIAGAQIACSNLSNGATGCSTATGTSGATIPLLNGANTWSGAQTIDQSDLQLLGSSTGYTTLNSGLSSTSNNTLTLPITSSDTLAALGTAETWTAAQTFTNGDLLLKGSSSGNMTLEAPAVASSYVMTFPAATDTVAVLGTAQTFTAAKTFTKSDFLLLGSSTGATTLNSGLSGSSSNTLTLPTTSSDTLAAIGTAQSWSALQTFGNEISFGGATLSVTSLATNNLLQYNGTNWVNVTPASIGAGVTSFSGDGTIFGNSSSTGAVTASLKNATPYSVLGNNGATGVAPSYLTSINISGNITTQTGGSVLQGDIYVPAMTTSSSAQTGTLCYNSGTSPVGHFTYDTTTGCLSSLEELKDIRPGGISEALSIIMKLKPFWYTWKTNTPQWEGNKSVSPGLGAHQVESVDKRLVGYDDKGNLKGVKYEQMTAILAAAVQQQQKEIEAMQGKRLLVVGHKCFFNLLVCAD